MQRNTKALQRCSTRLSIYSQDVIFYLFQNLQLAFSLADKLLLFAVCLS